MKSMTFLFSICLMLVSLSIGPAHALDEKKTAYAIPLKGITIDGKLDDWPGEMAVYPVAWVSSYYKKTPPEGPEDLLASFSVGYNSEKNVLYLAIVVQDDELVINIKNPRNDNQDLCEIYIDGDNSGGDNSTDAKGAQQYFMVPGPGLFRADIKTNPALNGGDILTAGVQAAYLRTGKITTYEWAVPIFERYPDRRLKIEPGKIIGFDVVVCDADSTENSNLVSWSPQAGKVNNSDLYGKLVFVQNYNNVKVMLGPTAPAFLIENYHTLGEISGKVTHKYDGSPWAGVEIYVKDDIGKIQNITITDKEGKYHVAVVTGVYSVSWLKDDKLHPVKAAVKPGEHVQNIDFVVPELGVISGKVTDKFDGSPQTRLWIRLYNIEKKSTEYTRTTDAEGRYTFKVKPGSYRITLLTGMNKESVEVTVKAGEEIHAVDLTTPMSSSQFSFLFLLGFLLLLCLILLYTKYKSKLHKYILIPLGIALFIFLTIVFLCDLSRFIKFILIGAFIEIIIFVGVTYLISYICHRSISKSVVILQRRFFLAGISLSILLLLNLILFGKNGFDLFFFLGILFAAALLLYPKYQGSLEEIFKKMVDLALLLCTVTTYILLLFLCYFMIINFPKEKPFEEKIIPLAVPQSETDAYQQYIALMKNVKFGLEVTAAIDTSRNFAQYDTLKIRQKILSVYPDIERILDFASKNTISSPESLYIFTSPIPNFSPLIFSMKGELFLIITDLANKEYDAAGKKYLRLWNVAYHQCSNKCGLVGHMIGVVMIDILINFDLKNHDRFRFIYNDDIIMTIQKIVDIMDTNMKDSLYIEALFMKKNISNKETFSQLINDIIEINKTATVLKPVPPSIIKRFFSWPFFDSNKAARMFDEYYYKTLFTSGKSMNGYKYNQLSKNLVYSNSFWRNPSVLLTGPGLPPDLNNFIQRKELFKSGSSD